jgi:EAL domain-containing protein (putative c-di-GMP-specific phosphodiesterase class I)
MSQPKGGIQAGDVALTPRVALVDDEPDVARMAGRHLRVTGAEVDVFTDPLQALAALRKGGYDVLVSDIQMPTLSGLELMRKVREFDLDLPIVVFTGTPTIETAKQAIEYGAFRYLTKPVSPEELGEAVRTAAVAHRMARIKRELASLNGTADARPGDLAGLSVAFDVALEQLWIAYQPIVRAADGSVFGYEALMRSDSKALPHPGAILEAAERLDRLVDVGRTVRNKAPEAMVKAPADCNLFVNLHPKDLLDSDIVSRAGPLAAIAPQVVLEITERASLDQIPDAAETIGALRKIGFRTALDDLGAGYAGLTAFAALEPDFVKLDMSLIRDIDTNVRKQKLVQSMVVLCHDLGALVVGEGVETLAERDRCIALGIDLLQGYLIAKPGRPFPGIVWT